MKPSILLFLLFSVSHFSIIAQTEINMENNQELPYYQIPDYPENFTAATVAARMIDGLGFRYFWATENLRDEDLNFKPNDEARTVEETLGHILSLSEVILNATKNEPRIRPAPEQVLTFEKLRRQTLENCNEASDILKANPEKSLEEYNIIFERSGTTSEYPFWNLINGPIADAIWHVGQVVSFRRSSGNPLNPKVSVFNGKLRD